MCTENDYNLNEREWGGKITPPPYMHPFQVARRLSFVIIAVPMDDPVTRRDDDGPNGALEIPVITIDALRERFVYEFELTPEQRSFEVIPFGLGGNWEDDLDAWGELVRMLQHRDADLRLMGQELALVAHLAQKRTDSEKWSGSALILASNEDYIQLAESVLGEALLSTEIPQFTPSREKLIEQIYKLQKIQDDLIDTNTFLLSEIQQGGVRPLDSGRLTGEIFAEVWIRKGASVTMLDTSAPDGAQVLAQSVVDIVRDLAALATPEDARTIQDLQNRSQLLLTKCTQGDITGNQSAICALWRFVYTVRYLEWDEMQNTCDVLAMNHRKAFGGRCIALFKRIIRAAKRLIPASSGA